MKLFISLPILLLSVPSNGEVTDPQIIARFYQMGVDCLSTPSWTDSQVAECLRARNKLLRSDRETAMAAYHPTAQLFLGDFTASLEKLLIPTVGIRKRAEYLMAFYAQRAGSETSCHQYLYRGREGFEALRAELTNIADESYRNSFLRSSRAVDHLKVETDQLTTIRDLEGHLEDRRLIYFGEKIARLHGGWHGYDEMEGRGEKVPPIGFKTLGQKAREILDGDNRCVWTTELPPE